MLNKKIECKADTKENRKMVFIWAIPLLSCFIIGPIIDLLSISGPSFSISTSFTVYIFKLLLFDLPKDLTQWWLLLVKILPTLPILWYLRTRNVSLTFNKKELIYKTMFGRTHKYNLEDISYYRTALRYYGDTFIPIGYTITIHMKSKRIIWIWDNDSNTEKLFMFLNNNKVNRKSSLF